jgi:hypothetical protein
VVDTGFCRLSTCVPPAPGEAVLLRTLFLHTQVTPVSEARRREAYDSGVLCAGNARIVTSSVFYVCPLDYGIPCVMATSAPMYQEERAAASGSMLHA